jgi:serine phosphatase RsbU (regulator of sigma subunit)
MKIDLGEPNDSLVLIVEDHPTSRKILESMLKGRYSVVAAADGQEAVSLAASRQPDIVLLDIELPEMDGFETLRHLRSYALDPSVPVIFLTGRADDESREKGLEAGAVDYLTKPYNKSELSIKVRNHLALHKARKEIERANRMMSLEMEMASQLQLSLLPRELPASERLDVRVIYRPSSVASGDFYDVFETDNGRVGFCQVDVSGHGVRSAMIGAMFKMAFHSLARGGNSPSEVLGRINDQMYDLIPEEEYLSVFYGVIDLDLLELTFTNGGHPSPYLYRKRNGTIEELSAGGMVVGAFPGVVYDESCLALETDDRILLYTDGVSEAACRTDEMEFYGSARLKEIFRANVDIGSQALLDRIIADLVDFHGGALFDDDVSLLLATIK